MKKLIYLSCLLLITFTTNAQVPSYLPTNGLIAWYSFTGNANDSSGNCNNGTVYGATLTTDRFGHANSAYYFNGTSNTIDIRDVNIPIGNSSRTISVWFKMDLPLPNTWSDIIELGDNLLGERLGLLYYMGELQVEFVNSSVGFDFKPDNSWHLLVVTYPTSGIGSSSIKMYLDGIEINNLIIANPITSLNTSASTSASIIYTIGGLYNNSMYSWKGTLDDIGIWNRALAQQEIRNIYTGITPRQFSDSKSTNITHPTPANIAITPTTPTINHSIISAFINYKWLIVILFILILSISILIALLKKNNSKNISDKVGVENKPIEDIVIPEYISLTKNDITKSENLDNEMPKELFNIDSDKIFKKLTNEDFIEIGKIIDSSLNWVYNDHFDDEEFHAVNGYNSINHPALMLKIYYNRPENPLILLDADDLTESKVPQYKLDLISKYIENKFQKNDLKNPIEIDPKEKETSRGMTKSVIVGIFVLLVIGGIIYKNSIKNKTSESINKTPESITFSQAETFMKQRCSSVNQTLTAEKQCNYNGNTCYMFLSVAENGEVCISMISAIPPLEIMAVDCGDVDEKTEQWNAIQ